MTALTTAKFDRIYRSLLVADVRHELSYLFSSRAHVDEEDLAYALSAATRLALSGGGDTAEHADAGRKAYDIAVRSLNFANGAGPTIRAVCDLVLGRIGNFPARQLLHEQAEVAESADPFLALESLVREHENKLPGAAPGTALTDFQVRLIKALESHQSVSVSAPTSAGKSFTLEVELLRRFKEDRSYVAVFLVPTRALIRQVTFDLVAMLRDNDLGSVSILSAPKITESPATPTKTIYVLTQERLATLLFSGDSHLAIDAVIVDEAHEIEELNRGQTLERVLALILKRFPESNLFFSSPLRSNPDKLLRLFGREARGESFVEHLSPVSQNIINIYKVPGKTKTARLELLIDKDPAPLGDVELKFRFRDSYMGNFAFHFTKPDETSIVYCNEPSVADRVAEDIADLITDNAEDVELSDLAAFLRQEVHPQYRLAAFVRKGVAFHYGNIPQIIRGRLEELLRARKIRFVCCTSTLLQGMNLPAKNIFVEDPKKGRGMPMKKGDFWNLVGRAGRLSKEFCGNVFCIFGKKWDPNITSDRLVPIESAFEVAVKERTLELLQVVKDPPISSESKELAWAEHAYARVYADFVASGKQLASPGEHDQDDPLMQIDLLSREFRRTLPESIFEENFYVHPRRLEDVAAFLRQQQDLRQWLPVYPHTRGSYYRLVAIFGLIEDLLIKTQTKSHEYYAFLANEWMSGRSLRDLVTNKIDYAKARTVKEVNTAIRELFRDLEEELRYKYVKYTRLYGQVLQAVLIERNMKSEADSLLPLHLFLEYGAASETLINLMSIGLSRTSAIFFRSFLSLRDNLTSHECQGYVDRVSIERSNLPSICIAEIVRLRRSRT